MRISASIASIAGNNIINENGQGNIQLFAVMEILEHIP
jgi:hypothetical protein